MNSSTVKSNSKYVRDEDILLLLMQDASLKYVELGEKLKISDVAVRKRINKLKDKGIIKRYTIEVDYRKMGYEITAFIGFDTKPEYYNSIINQLKSLEKQDPQIIYIQSIFQTSIDHDFMLECWFKNNDDLTAFINMLEKIIGITQVCPAIISQKIK